MFESIYCLGLKIRLIFWAMICKVKFLVVVVVGIVGGGGGGGVGLGVKLGGGDQNYFLGMIGKQNYI